MSNVFGYIKSAEIWLWVHIWKPTLGWRLGVSTAVWQTSPDSVSPSLFIHRAEPGIPAGCWLLVIKGHCPQMLQERTALSRKALILFMSVETDWVTPQRLQPWRFLSLSHSVSRWYVLPQLCARLHWAPKLMDLSLPLQHWCACGRRECANGELSVASSSFARKWLTSAHFPFAKDSQSCRCAWGQRHEDTESSIRKGTTGKCTLITAVFSPLLWVIHRRSLFFRRDLQSLIWKPWGQMHFRIQNVSDFMQPVLGVHQTGPAITIPGANT